MTKSKFSLTSYKDERVIDLIKATDKKILAMWAMDCAQRILPYFEEKYPNDDRPQQALRTLREWIDTGIFRMSVIRKASLDSHAAAREVGQDNPARSAARACGQAVATAHVKTHSLGSAIYALQAIHRVTNSIKAVEQERAWQYRRLLKLR